MSQELSNSIRSEIHSSGKRLPTIAKKAGVTLSALSEFMDGADMHLTSASKIATYLGLELKQSAERKRATKQPANASPPRKAPAKKGRTMKPRGELVEDQATRAYFRRYGESAQQPNRKATKLFEQDGKHYIRLSNSNGPLATYRITPRTGGGWKLSFVDEKHEGEIENS
jgi:hypothetical protein